MLPVIGFPRILIFYREARHSIEVLRILHGARDIGVSDVLDLSD